MGKRGETMTIKLIGHCMYVNKRSILLGGMKNGKSY